MSPSSPPHDYTGTAPQAGAQPAAASRAEKSRSVTLSWGSYNVRYGIALALSLLLISQGALSTLLVLISDGAYFFVTSNPLISIPIDLLLIVAAAVFFPSTGRARIIAAAIAIAGGPRQASPPPPGNSASQSRTRGRMSG